MDAKHTPGEWAVLPEEVDRSYIRIRGTVLGGRYKIANVLTPVYDNAPEREAEQTRANARLIAAAPMLLSSLRAAANYIDTLGGDSKSYRMLIAATINPEPTP